MSKRKRPTKKEKDLFIEPVTRLEGHLGVHARVDVDAKKIVDAHSFATMFRGWEIILRNREPADAVWITQRICGVCPVPHAIASVEAVDMAYNAPPPPMGILLRNLVHGAEQLYDAPLGCFILEGPDYSQAVVEKSNPSWWKEATKAKADRSDMHGYSSIADIMRALNPLTGELWLRSLGIERLGRRMASLFGAKHPHVNTLVPGGITASVSPKEIEMYASMLSQHVAFTKEFVAIFDDLLDFFIELGYDESGVRPTNLLCCGIYEDPYEYTAKYEDLTGWGEGRKVSPGVVIDGKLWTTDLVEINVGIREFVTHSYYEDWDEVEIETDPLGNELPKEHPWNKETKPKPGPIKAWEDKYSWAAAPRWQDWSGDGKLYALETGPIARMWVTSLAKNVPESTGKSLRFTLPKAVVAGYRVADEVTLEWKIPAKINTLERIRARAYFHAYSAYVMYSQLLQAMDLVKKGEVKVWNSYGRPRDGMGYGTSEAMRGAINHWVVMRNGKVYRYQVITPSGWNNSPRGPEEKPGPYEEALIGTPITEASTSDKWKGVDVVRVIRSFDPCLACDVHVYVGDMVIIRELDHHHDQQELDHHH